MAYNFYNQPMMNQLLRYKDSIDSMINQMNIPQPQPPVQNIINTTGTATDFEARILNEDEDVNNIFVMKKTMFLDRTNKKLLIKEVDGKISEEYEIVVPLDEKDIKIIELEKRLKDMEEKINVKLSEPIEPNDESKETNANVDGVSTKKSTKSSKSVPRNE